MTNNKIKNQDNFFEGEYNLGEILNRAAELRGLDLKKLSESTDIPIHYLAALSNGDFEKLPAAPYIRGYLVKIAETLRIDTDLLLKTYKQEISLRSLRTSGPEDKLPVNRFTFKTSHRKKSLLAIGLVAILIIAFLIWRADDFLGTPRIEIINPAADNLVVNTPSVKLLGKVNPNDKLTIYGEEISVGKDSRFEKEFSLQPGLNRIEFKAKRFLGGEVTVVRQVIYQP